MGEVVLVMIDECGDEIEIEHFHLQLDLDEDEFEVWKERKIEKAAKRFCEAQGFFFEDRRGWERAILADICEWL